MTEDVTESGHPVDGATSGPTGEASTPTGDQQTSSNNLSGLEERLTQLIKSTVKEEAEKAWQSGKDKRIAGLQEKVSQKVDTDEFEARLARLDELMKSKGLSREDAIWRMKVEDAVFSADPRQTQDAQGEVPEDKPAGTGQPQASTAQSSIIKGLGLDPNNADVVQAIREAGSDLTSLTTKLSRFAIQKAQAQAAPANEAQVLPTQTSGGDATTLESLLEEQAKLQQSFDQKSMKRRREIKERIAELLPKQ